MQEISTKQLRLHKKSIIPTIILAFISAVCVILSREKTETLYQIAGITFAYTDIFVILAAGIGGMGCGLLSFTILFIGDFLRVGGDYISLYSISTYLILVLVTAHLSYIAWFKGILKSILSCVIISGVLSLCWLFTFTVILPSDADTNLLQGLSYYKLFLGALPETAFSTIIITLFFQFAPDRVKLEIGSGWAYLSTRQPHGRRKQTLSIRITAFSLLEAVLLCIIAIFCHNLFEAAKTNATFNLSFLRLHWQDSLRLGLTMFCGAIPISYLFNDFIINYIVRPVNSMSFLMEKYFEMDEKDRGKTLPDLGIHSGDEVEKLYHSLQKMVADMGNYIERELEQERKSAHLTHGFMLALAKAVDAKDRYTSGHSVRVAKYSKEIASRLGKSEKEQEEIYTMGLLHDIGKIGVPEAIINKNGKLTDEEFAKIKEHPVMGYQILQNVTELPTLATGARWHHERYDGRGYPDGLTGENIPEEARIIAVADAYDAMTSKRAYSDIRAQEEVRNEIIRCRGSQFDPEIADIFITMIDDDTEYTMHE